MTDTQLRYFELHDHHGVDYAGNLEPINNVGLGIPTSVLVARGDKRGVSPATHSLSIRPADKLGDEAARVIPDTRIIETSHSLVADKLLDCGQYREIDKPTKTLLDQHVKRTHEHLEAMRNRDKQVAAGDAPAPDATDQPEATS